MPGLTCATICRDPVAVEPSLLTLVRGRFSDYRLHDLLLLAPRMLLTALNIYTRHIMRLRCYTHVALRSHLTKACSDKITYQNAFPVFADPPS